MVITMALRRTILRGETYYFRMPVPKDCIEAIGKTEIVVSLKTKDPMATKATVARLEAFWTDRFNEARESKSHVTVKQSIPAPPDEDSVSFRQGLVDQMDKNLPKIFKTESDADLRHRLDSYEGCISDVKENRPMQYDIPEIGISWPFEPAKSPGFDRARKRILCEVLQLMCKAVATELGLKPESHNPKGKKIEKPLQPQTATTVETAEHSIVEVVELMIAAKRVPEKTAVALRADVKLLKEWCGGKNDLRSYTKRDLIDFVQNALPYLPANMNKKKVYAGKTVRECVALTKSDLKTYKPISHRTCENRQTNISIVFNYAKDHLGLITVNPARDIEVPEVRVTTNRLRGYSPHELTAMWTALEKVRQRTQYPSHYWATVLSLYHGFRLNEVCSLFLDDVYEDEDGVFVIDINDDGPLKSVKNQSSVRIVPVHPFVRDQLGFKDFVESQKSARSEGVLFTNVRGTEKNGYIRQTSYWFARWKLNWLAPKAQYKHFHDLRYTFIQTAQNSAKMPDRHSQEITGHSIEGVSAVHLGYSGRLKPAALLEELQKVKYGWEAIPDDSETARASD